MKISPHNLAGVHNLKGVLQHAKSQLADVQKLLVQSNRQNQAERKMVLSGSDAENTQQLSEEKKLLIVNLAERQRNLLDAFKRYRSLVQRLKTVKDQRWISSSMTNQKSAFTRKFATLFCQNMYWYILLRAVLNDLVLIFSRSESTEQPLISTLTPTDVTNHSVLTPTLAGQTANNCSQMLTKTSENASKSVPGIVLTNAINPGLTKAVKEGSVKLILLQNQSNNLRLSEPISSSGDYSKQDVHLNRPISRSVKSIARMQTAPQVQRTTSGTACQNVAVTPITIADTSLNKSPSNLQPFLVKSTLPSTNKNLTRVPTYRFAKTQAPVATRPQTQANPLLRPAMSTNLTQPAIKQTQTVSNRLAKQIPESYLTLGNLLRQGVVAPGNNVLTASSEVKNLSRSKNWLYQAKRSKYYSSLKN